MDKDASFRRKAFAHLKALADESPAYDDAKMLVASADTVASLKNNTHPIYANFRIDSRNYYTIFRFFGQYFRLFFRLCKKTNFVTFF